MKNFRYISIGIGALVLMNACAPRVTTMIFKQLEPLDQQTEVVILGKEDSLPEVVNLLGSLQISTVGVHPVDCRLPIITEKAKTAARKIGGNALQIYQYERNDNGCPNITANIINISKSEHYPLPNLPKDADYALLHIYRHKGYGSAINYDVHLDSTIIARSLDNWRETIKIEDEGNYRLRARTEVPFEIPLDIRLGNEYYVKSGVTYGLLIGRPHFAQMDDEMGRVEFQSINSNVRYTSASDTASLPKRLKFKRFRWGISGGFGYRMAKIPDRISPILKDHLYQLKTGFTGDLSATYFFFETFGIGLKGNVFFANAQTKGVSDQTRTTFIGPQFSLRLFDAKKQNSYLFDWGMGYLGYRDKGVSAEKKAVLTGQTLGWFANFGRDIRISSSTSLGFQLTFSLGSLSKYRITEGTRSYKVYPADSEREGLGRIDVSVGLRF